MIIKLFEAMIGFASGIAVGAGFVAVLTMLGIIPRLVQLSKTKHAIKLYTASVVLGTQIGAYLSFTTITLNLSNITLVIWGLFHGVFIGMIAAALTEVLNVYPIMAKRIKLYKYVWFLMMAIVFGKVFGSLFQWMFFVR